jgi:hypothetical protein
MEGEMDVINKMFNAFVANEITKTVQYKKIVTSKVKLIERIKEAAENGEYQITIIDINYAGYWYEIKTWLENLGFSVGHVPHSWSKYYIQWDDESLAEGLK